MSETTGPFDNEQDLIRFVQSARLYDVAMAILQHLNPEAAERLLTAHSNGVLVGPSPAFTGEFMFDVANAPSPDGDAPNERESES